MSGTLLQLQSERSSIFSSVRNSGGGSGSDSGSVSESKNKVHYVTSQHEKELLRRDMLGLYRYLLGLSSVSYPGYPVCYCFCYVMLCPR